MLVVAGFALRPSTYEATTARLATRARTTVVDLFAERRWDAPTVIDWLGESYVDHDVETVVTHSFGTGPALEALARRPGPVRRLVVCDSIGVGDRLTLVRSVATGFSLFRMATPRAALDFVGTVALRPRTVAGAGWWAFRSSRVDAIEAVRRSAIQCHVVWASRDTLLRRSDGRRFAEQLGPDFRLVAGGSEAIDHDWVFRHPELLPQVLEDLGALPATSSPHRAAPRRSSASGPPTPRATRRASVGRGTAWPTIGPRVWVTGLVSSSYSTLFLQAGARHLGRLIQRTRWR